MTTRCSSLLVSPRPSWARSSPYSKPDNTIAKLLVVIGSSWLLAAASRIYLWMSLHVDLPLTDLAAWLVSWLFFPAWALIPVLLAVFPAGRVATGWLRVPVRVYLWFFAVILLLPMVLPQDLGESYGDYLEGFENPAALEVFNLIEGTPAEFVAVVVLDVGSAIFVLGLAVAALADIVRRWRRSAGVERLQMGTFALGGFVMVLLLVSSSVMAGVGRTRLLENLGTTLAISAHRSRPESPSSATGYTESTVSSAARSRTRGWLDSSLQSSPPSR